METDLKQLCYKLISCLVESRKSGNKESAAQTLHDALVTSLLGCLKYNEGTPDDAVNRYFVCGLATYATTYGLLVQLSVSCPLGGQLTSSVHHNWQEGLSQIIRKVMELKPRPTRLAASFEVVKMVYSVCGSECVEGSGASRTAWLCPTTLNTVTSLIQRDLQQVSDEGCLNKADNKTFELIVSWLESSLVVCSGVHNMPTCLDQRTLPLLLAMIKQALSRFNESITARIPDVRCYKSWYALEKSLYTRQQRLFELYEKSNGSTKDSLQLLAEWFQASHNLLVDRIQAYHVGICKNIILHDKDSHDWTSSRPLFRGERISFHIQMWQYYLTGLLYDLRREASPIAAVRVLQTVLVETVYYLTQYYATLTPSQAHTKRYRADVMGVLVTVSFLLPHIDDPLSVSPNLSLLHNSCCRLLHNAASDLGCPSGAAGGADKPAPPTWQQHLVPLISGCGLHSHDESTVGLIQSIVCLPKPSWTLLMKVLLEDNGGLSVRLCQSGCDLVRDIAEVLLYCYHKPHLLSDVFLSLNIRLGDGDDVSVQTVQWLKDYLTPLLERSVLESLVEFVLRQEHEVGVMLCVQKMLDKLYHSFKLLQSDPVLWLLLHRLLGQDESSVSKFLSDLMCGMLKFSDSVTISTLHIKNICGKYTSVIHRLFAASDQVRKLLQVFADKPSVKTNKVELRDDDLHNIATDLVLSEQRGRDALENIYNWIKRNTDIVCKSEPCCDWMGRDLYPYELYTSFLKSHHHLLLETELNLTEISQ